MTAHRTFGALLTRLRRQHGLSQQGLANLLCAVSDGNSVSRHEISRWERGERLPGSRWLAWLALALRVAPADLTLGVRRLPGSPAASPLGQLLAAAGQWARAAPPSRLLCGQSDVDVAYGGLLGDLRTMDDLASGGLAPKARDHWQAARRRVRSASRAGRPALCRPAAELARLAGWTAADAGDPRQAVQAFRSGIRLAWDDRSACACLLLSASHALSDHDPRAAWVLAQAAASGVRATGSPGLRALAGHRVAYAAAICGDRHAAANALHAAMRLAERADPAAEPGQLYWLDQREFAAMTGRCLVLLGRSRQAVPLLTAGIGGRPPRTRAIYSGWLARALLETGEVDQACAAGEAALIDTLRSGSARAATLMRRLDVRLHSSSGVRSVRELRELIRQFTTYLPDHGPPTPID